MSATNGSDAAQDPPPSSGHDSAYSHTTACSTRTLSSRFNSPREENGRLYNSVYEYYLFPCDEAEQDRLDEQHMVFRKALDSKLFLAPISYTPQHVLDVGTGTGIWALEFADTYPTASVLGFDISFIQPTMVAPNCKFEIDDANQDWVFRYPFDYIHCRHVPMVKQKRLFQQSLENLKPGGWLEIQEMTLPSFCSDGSLYGTALWKWQEEMTRALHMINYPFDNWICYQQWMKEAGFINVRESRYSIPTNDWPKDPKLKELGSWQCSNLRKGLQGDSLALFTGPLGRSKEDLDDFLAEVKKDITNRKIHAFSMLVVVIGQKPIEVLPDLFG